MSSSSSSSADSSIQFMHTLALLKETPRTGWVENKVNNVESVADHMYRMSVLCMMCPDASLDRNRMTKMALCHDMAEALVGDISPAMKVPKDVKYAKEVAALNEMMDPLGEDVHREEMKALWHEYEDQETPEAKFVKDMDLLEMILQAAKYENSQGKDLAGFFTSGEKIQHPWAKGIFERLRAQRGQTPAAPKQE